jgi:hypothetical protein
VITTGVNDNGAALILAANRLSTDGAAKTETDAAIVTTNTIKAFTSVLIGFLRGQVSPQLTQPGLRLT